LNNLQDARVRVIRTGIANNDQGVDFAQRVYGHNIRIEWNPGVNGPMAI